MPNRNKDDIQPIEDTREIVVKAILQGKLKPKKEWCYPKRARPRR